MQADDILFGFRTMDFDVRHFAYSLKGTQTEGASWPEKTENVRRFPSAGFTRFFSLYLAKGGTFQATAGFQDSDIFQKAMKMALRCSLSVNPHL